MNLIYSFVHRPIQYLKNRFSPRQFFIFSSIVVGLLSGAAAVALKFIVHQLAQLVSRYDYSFFEIALSTLFPLVGIFLTVLCVKYLLRSPLKKGSAEISYAIVKESSLIPPRETYAHLITSGITVGLGGSVGLESPMVSTGSAIGSNFGSQYKLSYKERTILLACGAAAGIAAAFNSPIAGVLFAVEALLVDVSVSAFIPLIVSAACGALLSKVILKEGVVLSFSLQQPFDYHNVPFYMLLGLLAGLVSVYYASAFTWIGKQLSHVKNDWSRAAAGGLMLFILLILFPPLFGEGYETIKALANLQPAHLAGASPIGEFIKNEWHLLFFLGCLVFVKAVAAAITLGSGGNGGNFGPSLFVGAYLGYVFSRIVNLTGISSIPESNFTIVGMAGILSGVFFAPLTAIFLIAEITGGYELMIPLMIVSSLSIIIVHVFEPQSMEARKLHAMLNVAVDNRDKFLLSKLQLGDLLETNFSVVHPDENLLSLIKTISSSSRNQFPVLGKDDELVGIVHMDHVRKVIFDPMRDEKLLVRQLMSTPQAVIEKGENLHSVLQKFDQTKLWNLPVTENGRYIGFLSKSSILSKYRNELLESV
jgi:chloride channel protein, CIC family